MNKEQFNQWLLGKYRPPIEVANDELEGALIFPHIIMADKEGKFFAFCRWLGRLLRNTHIYEMGTRQVNMYDSIMERLKSTTDLAGTLWHK